MRLLRRILQALLRETWRDRGFDLAIYLVSVPEITRLNEAFLQHKGSTDVITFDYAEKAESAFPEAPSWPRKRSHPDRRAGPPALLHGEIFVCVDEALSQARRFRATWQTELVRYVVHGLLHLLGYDDRDARARRRMRETEDALIGQLARRFDLQRLSASKERLRKSVGSPKLAT